jgi:hypothetical protein
MQETSPPTSRSRSWRGTRPPATAAREALRVGNDNCGNRFLETCHAGKPAVRLDAMEKIKIEQHSFSGTLWFAGWLFTIGFLHLTFWKGALAIVLWPYYLGLLYAR